MPLASALLLDRRDNERVETQRRLEDFDKALEELRKAKDRLNAAANLYLERLQGVRDDQHR